MIQQSRLSHRYYSDESVSADEYRVDGHLHREDGPAMVHYERDGSIEAEFWFYQGKRHCSTGPAHTAYPCGTQGIIISYWKHGKRLDPNMFDGIMPGTPEFTFTFEMA